MTGEELARWRKNHHLTQHQLGMLLGGLSKYAVCRMEQNRRQIPLSCVFLLDLAAHPAIRKYLAGKTGVVLPESPAL